MAYTTLEAVRRELGVQTGDDDALLSAYITQAQGRIDSILGFTCEAAADSTRYFDAVEDVLGRQLFLDHPLCAITSITNGGTALASSDYVAEPVNGPPWSIITLYRSGGKVWTYTTDPEKAIVIVGKWGWSATAPVDIQRATTRLAAYWYRLKDAQVFDVTMSPETGQLTIPKGLPVDVNDILKTYLRHWRTR